MKYADIIGGIVLLLYTLIVLLASSTEATVGTPAIPIKSDLTPEMTSIVKQVNLENCESLELLFYSRYLNVARMDFSQKLYLWRRIQITCEQERLKH
jgi:hypothetical protein